MALQAMTSRTGCCELLVGPGDGVAGGERGTVRQPLPCGDAFFSSLPQCSTMPGFLLSPRFYVKAQ